MRRIILLILLLFSWIAVPVQAGLFKYSFFYNPRMNEGISQLSVIAMCQDTRGYLWLGTRNGLNRYNGSTYTVYTHQSGDSLSLAGNEVSSLAEQGGRYLWIATSRGLSRLSLTTDSIRNYSVENGLPDMAVSSVYVDRNRQVWVGTRRGLARYLPEKDCFEPVRFAADTLSVSAILEDVSGRFWIGTRQKGVYLCSDKMQLVKHFCEEEGSLAGASVSSLYEDAYYSIWVGTTPGGVNRIDPHTHTVTCYTSENSGLKNKFVRCMAEWNGELLLGTYDGVYSFNQLDNKITKVGGYDIGAETLGHYSVYSFCLDRTGTLWIGTYGGGISQLSVLSSRFVSHFPGTWNSIRTGIYGTACYDKSGRLWIATEGYGLLNYDIQTGKTHFYLIAPSAYSVYNANVIKTVWADDDCIWCGTTRGEVYRFDLNSCTFRLFHRFSETEAVQSILRDSSGNLWVGVSGGECLLVCFTPSGERIEHIVDRSGRRLSINFVRCMVEERPGVLWIGTLFSGLLRLEIDSLQTTGADKKVIGALDVYSMKAEDAGHAIGSNYISAIVRTGKREVWFSTYGGGIYRIDNRGRIATAVTDEKGLMSNTVCHLVEGAGNTLWMSTDKGISCYSATDGDIKNYPYANGINVREFTLHGGVALPDGTVCFTGNDCFVTFHTPEMPVNTYVPPVVLEHMQVNNRPVEVGDETGILDRLLDDMQEVRLSYDQNNIAISYRALNFINSSMNRYAYRLEGYDKEWNEVGGRTTAYYTKLPAGTYRFHVRASNNDGVWNEAGRTLRIVIAPPLWATWYAWLLYAVAAVSVAYVILYYYNVRRRLREELRAEQREKLQQQGFHQAKMRLFTNLAHELRTPLTLIITPFEELVKRIDLGHELHSKLEVIYKNAQRLLLLVNQLMDLQKNQNGAMELRVIKGNVCEFVREIYYAFKQIAQTNEVNFTLKCRPNSFVAWYDPTLLEKIVFNLLSNAFKYTPAGKSIHMEVEFDQERGMIRLRVEDSGCGIPEEEREKVFTPFYQVAETAGVNISGTGIGLSLVYSIVQLYKGNIRIDDRPDGKEGTLFSVELPATGDAFTEQEKDVMPMETVGNTAFVQPIEPAPAVMSIAGDIQKKPVVLIVEDDKGVRDYLHQSLEADYEIIEAVNGVKGYERAVQDFPDLILSDIMMPKRNGLELCKLVKEDMRTGHIPVILMTARSMVVHIKEGFQAGADDYIIKPFSMDVLRIRIHSLLQSRQRLKKLYGRSFSPEVIGATIVSADERFSQKLYEVIEKNISNPDLSVEMLCHEIGISRANLYRKIKAISELSPTELIRNKRLEVAMKYLKETNMTVSDIAVALGFSSHSYFSNSFKAFYGMSPSEFMQRNIKE